MEITGKEMQEISNVLSKIINKPMQLKLAYRLTRFAEKIQSVLKDLDKKRVVLVKKYGVEDKEKKTFSVPKEKLYDFHKEFNLILDEVVSIDITPIPFDLLVAAGVEISPAELVSIEQFIDKPKET